MPEVNMTNRQGDCSFLYADQVESRPSPAGIAEPSKNKDIELSYWIQLGLYLR